MPIKTLIVDDEAPARQRLTRLLTAFDEIQIVAEAENAEQALEQIASLKPQLLFLDISMPAMSGIQLAEIVAKQNPQIQIVFTTAYDEYALDAFEVNAKDYLLKPIRSERLSAAIKKITPVSKEPDFILLKDSKMTEKVALDSIIYLHADHKYTEVYLNNKQFLSADSLKEFEQKYPAYFLRIHRSTLVSKKYLRGIEQQQQSMLAVLDGIEAKPEVSRRHQADIRKFLNSLL